MHSSILTIDFSPDPQGWLSEFPLRSIRWKYLNTLEDSG